LLDGRGFFTFSTLDALLDDAAITECAVQRRAVNVEAQQILARDLSAVNLWYRNTIVVHNGRLKHVAPKPSGSLTFLETAELVD